MNMIPHYPIALSEQDWNVVLNALSVQPFRDVAPVIGKIQGAFEAMNTPKEDPEEKAEEPSGEDTGE